MDDVFGPKKSFQLWSLVLTLAYAYGGIAVATGKYGMLQFGRVVMTATVGTASAGVTLAALRIVGG